MVHLFEDSQLQPETKTALLEHGDWSRLCQVATCLDSLIDSLIACLCACLLAWLLACVLAWLLGCLHVCLLGCLVACLYASDLP